MRATRIKIKSESAVYHCMSRCVGGEALLDQEAREMLRKQMWQVSDFCGVEIITYCLMSNHLHVLVRVPYEENVTDDELMRRFRVLYTDEHWRAKALEKNLAFGGEVAQQEREALLRRMGDVSIFMKEWKQRFSIWYNHRHHRFGTLWAERFKSLVVENTALAMRVVAAYIDLNPVRAHLVEDPADYRWCGYAEALGGGKCAQNGLSQVVDSEDWAEAQACYRKLLYCVGEVPSKDGDAVLDSENQKPLSLGQLIRRRVRYFNDGAILGGKSFVRKVYQENRSCFQSKKERVEVGHMPEGVDWHGLHVFRNLRR